jgi:hypothetical protein
VVWCGVVWCGVVWCGVVRLGWAGLGGGLRTVVGIADGSDGLEERFCGFGGGGHVGDEAEAVGSLAGCEREFLVLVRVHLRFCVAEKPCPCLLTSLSRGRWAVRMLCRQSMLWFSSDVSEWTDLGKTCIITGQGHNGP